MDIPELLKFRDYTIIIDRSGSMGTPDQKNHKTRWQVMKETTKGLAFTCEGIDPDGITIYTFSDRFKRFDNVTSSKVEQIFTECFPSGGTSLDEVLQDAIENYFQRRSTGQSQPNGETILVFTDGEPDDRRLVTKILVEAANQLEKRSELGICFIQVGDDKEATNFLDKLNNSLDEFGAKFDICHALHRLDVSDIHPIELLMRAIKD
jgi:uncharacterized protein YegL